eukprot:scaffold35032_cov72-Cyclotella_meneghiniana.AAC.9
MMSLLAASSQKDGGFLLGVKLCCAPNLNLLLREEVRPKQTWYNKKLLTAETFQNQQIIIPQPKYKV